MAGALERVNNSIVAAYRRRVKLTENDLRKMMQAETWISAAEAVEWGFADRIEGRAQMAACAGFDWHKFGYAHAPPRLTAGRVKQFAGAGDVINRSNAIMSNIKRRLAAQRATTHE